MKRQPFLILLQLLFVLNVPIQAQVRNCGTTEDFQNQITTNPQIINEINRIEEHIEEYSKRSFKTEETFTVPIVVHVIYEKAIENISESQIQSQIEILNKDFRRLNTDYSNTPNEFKNYIADINIEFCLTEINRVHISSLGVSVSACWNSNYINDNIKKNTVIDSKKFLNVWVVKKIQTNNCSPGVLGYAQFPGFNSQTDGIVVSYQYFGDEGTAQAPFNLGRTMTHEVGHWLNLDHIWGNQYCGSDNVNDTPVHDNPNYSCPSYPHKSNCANNVNEMTMNYMDYTNDACMFMFTEGQKSRMRAILSDGGPRYDIVKNSSCEESENLPFCFKDQIIYKTNSNGIHSLYWYEGEWKWSGLDNAGKIGSGCAGDLVTADGGQIWYRANDGGINSIYCEEGEWKWSGLNNAGKIGSGCAGDLVTVDGSQIWYRANDGGINSIYWDNGEWKWSGLKKVNDGCINCTSSLTSKKN